MPCEALWRPIGAGASASCDVTYVIVLDADTEVWEQVLHG
jgi:hypothetical protein